VYVRGSGKTWTCELLYVDDLLIFSASPSILTSLVDSLCHRFKMNDLGVPTRYLGMMISREAGHITVTQRDYILTLVERYGMATARRVETPMDTERTVRSSLEGWTVRIGSTATMRRAIKRSIRGL
jgi:hypothetical protein